MAKASEPRPKLRSRSNIFEAKTKVIEERSRSQMQDECQSQSQDHSSKK